MHTVIGLVMPFASKPYPASILFRQLSSACATINMMSVQIISTLCNIAFFFVLHYCFFHTNALLFSDVFLIARPVIVPFSINIFSTAKVSRVFHLPLFCSIVTLPDSDDIQINGAVYNSRPIPQFTQARLKLSEASPFSFSA